MADEGVGKGRPYSVYNIWLNAIAPPDPSADYGKYGEYCALPR
jgi:hypothetical protein